MGNWASASRKAKVFAAFVPMIVFLGGLALSLAQFHVRLEHRLTSIETKLTLLCTKNGIPETPALPAQTASIRSVSKATWMAANE